MLQFKMLRPAIISRLRKSLTKVSVILLVGFQRNFGKFKLQTVMFVFHGFFLDFFNCLQDMCKN